MSELIRAAGGIPVRELDDELEVLVVHRAHYDDWTFPKGKCELGETDEECAVREVQEETGLLCALGEELRSTFYTDGKGRPKTVRYWLMSVVGGELAFDNEVADARWLGPEEAAELLTFERDVELLRDVARALGRPAQ
jgi:8-oxo-dGTP diphosphatase